MREGEKKKQELLITANNKAVHPRPNIVVRRVYAPNSRSRNYLVLSLPYDYTRRLEIEKGDYMNIEIDLEKKTLTISRADIKDVQS